MSLAPKVRWIAALAVALILAHGTPLVVANAASPSPGPPAPAGAPPAPGVVVGLVEPMTSLDPADSGCPPALAAALYRPLVTFHNGSIYDVDEEASQAAVTVDDDGRHVAIVLRSDAAFSDGSKVTAQDVQDTLARLLGVDAAHRPQHPAIDPTQMDGIESIQVAGTQSVNLTLKTSDASIVSLLASERAGIVKSGSLAGDKPPVGGGPFVVRGAHAGGGWDLGPNAHAARVPDHALSLVPAPAGSARIFWLASGQGQVVAAPPGGLERDLDPEQGFGVARAPSPGAIVMAIDTSSAPTNNLKIREALVHGIDRAPMAAHVLGGRARPAHGYLDPFHSTKAPDQPSAGSGGAPSPTSTPSAAPADSGAAGGDSQQSTDATSAATVAPDIQANTLVVPTTPSDFDRIFAQKMLDYVHPEKPLALDCWIVADGQGGITDPEGLADDLRISMDDIHVGLAIRIVPLAQLDAQLSAGHPHCLVMAVPEPFLDSVFRLRALRAGTHAIGKVAAWSPLDFPALLRDGLRISGSTRDYLCQELSKTINGDFAVATLVVGESTWLYRDPVKALHFTPMGAPDFTSLAP